MTIREKNSDDISTIGRVIAIFEPSQFSFLVSGNQPSPKPKLNMAIAQSFLKIQSSSFLQTSPFFYVEKDFASNLGGHWESFLVNDWLQRAKIEVPPQKNLKFFLKSFVNG